MTGYVRTFDDNTTTSFKVSNKQLLKKHNQIWKNVKSLLIIKFDSEPVYGVNDKCIKAKIKTYCGSAFTNFQGEKIPKENHAVFINNNGRLCCQSKGKVLSSNIFGKMQI